MDSDWEVLAWVACDNVRFFWRRPAHLVTSTHPKQAKRSFDVLRAKKYFFRLEREEVRSPFFFSQKDELSPKWLKGETKNRFKHVKHERFLPLAFHTNGDIFLECVSTTVRFCCVFSCFLINRLGESSK